MVYNNKCLARKQSKYTHFIFFSLLVIKNFNLPYDYDFSKTALGLRETSNFALTSHIIIPSNLYKIE